MTRYVRHLSFPLILLLVLSLLGLNATYTEKATTEQQNFNTAYGQLEITGGDLPFTVTSSAYNMVPGDEVQKDIVLHNAATYSFATVNMSVEDFATNDLFASHPEGLQLTVERESYNGSGVWNKIYGPAAAKGNDLIANIGGDVLDPGGYTHLRVTQKFVGEDNAGVLKAKEASLKYIFTGTARGNTSGITSDPVLTGELALPYGTGADLSWQDVQYAETYDVNVDYYELDGSFLSTSVVESVPADHTLATISHSVQEHIPFLSAKYSCLSLTAKNNASARTSARPSSLDELDTSPLCGITYDIVSPANFIAEPQENSIRYSWDPVSDVTGYRLYVKGIKNPLAITPNTYVIINNLPNNTPVTAWVTAYKSSSESPRSNEVTSTPVDDSAPVVPTFTLSAPDPDKVQVVTAPVNETDMISVRVFNNGTYIGSIEQNSVSGAKYTFTVPLGSTNNVTISTVDSSGNESLQSEPQTIVSPPAQVPHIITTLGDRSVAVSWDPIPGAVDYEIKYGSNTTVVTTVSTILTDLTPWEPLLISVAPRNAGGTISPPTSIEVTPLNTQAPATPYGFTSTYNPDGTLSFSWIPSLGAATYSITRDGTYLGEASTTTYEDLTTVSNTKYVYEIRAISSTGDASAPLSQALTTLPKAPTNLRGFTGNGTVELYWDASDTSDVTFVIYANGNELTTSHYQGASITGLDSAEPVLFEVKAENISGLSLSSNTLALTPTNTQPPAAPTSFHQTAYDLETGEVTLQWLPSPDQDIEGYILYRSVNGAAFERYSDVIMGTTYTDTPDPTSTTRYKLVAKDDAGNVSNYTPEIVGLVAPLLPTITSITTGNDSLATITLQTPQFGAPAASYAVSYPGLPTPLILPAAEPGLTQTLVIGPFVNGEVSATLAAKNQVATSAPINIPSFTVNDVTPPDPPSTLVVHTAATSAALTWDAPNSFDTALYRVYVNNTFVGTSTSRSYDATGLTPNINYSFKVSAVDINNNESAATSQNATTALNAPENFTVTAGQKSITLTWDPLPGDGIEYRIYMNSGDFLTSTTATTYTFNNLTAGTPYEYFVRASLHNNEGPKTASKGAVPYDVSLATAPTNLKQQIRPSTTAKGITWDPVTINRPSTYTIYRNGTEVTTVDKSVTSYLDSGAPPAFEHTYYIVTTNEFGVTSTPSASLYTPPQPPTYPTGTAHVTYDGNGMITATWDPLLNAEDYEVRVVYTAPVVYETTERKVTFYGALPNCTYTIQISGRNASGIGASGSTYITTTDTTPPSQIKNIRELSATETTAVIAWDPSPESDVNEYELWASSLTNPTDPFLKLDTIPATTTSYSLPLNNARLRTFYVVAKDMAGNTAPPSDTSFKAAPTSFKIPAPNITYSNSSDRASMVAISPVTLPYVDLPYQYNFYVNGVFRSSKNVDPSKLTYHEVTGLLPDVDQEISITTTHNGHPATESAPTSITVRPVDMAPPSIPTNLVGVASQEGHALTWTASPESDTAQYRIYQNNTYIGSTETTSFFTSSVITGVSNYYTITAVDTYGHESAPTGAFRLETPPGTVQKPLTTPQNGAVKLDWAVPAGIVNYYDVFVDNADTPYVSVQHPLTSATIANLTNGERHSFRVLARNDIGKSARSEVIVTSPQEVTQKFTLTNSAQYYTVPQGVTSLYTYVAGSAGTGSRGGIVSSYVPVTPGEILQINVGGKNGYNGGQGLKPGGGASDIRRDPSTLNDRIITAGGGGAVTSTPNNDTTLSNGGYHATAGSNPRGYGWTAAQPGTLTSAGAGASIPAGVSAYPGNPGTFGLGGASSQRYNSYYGGGGGGGWYGGGGGYASSPYITSSGAGGSSYAKPEVVYLDYNDAANTEDGYIVVGYTTNTAPPPIPTTPQATYSSTSDTTGEIKITPSPYAAYYKISKNGQPAQTHGMATYEITEISPDSQDIYTITAYNINNQPSPGAATVYVGRRPLTPKELYYTPTATSVKLTWQTGGGAVNGYNIFQGAHSTTPIATTSSPSYIISNLTPNQPYTFRIQAYGPAGVSPEASIVATPTSSSIPPVTGLAATSSSTGTYVSWNPSTNPEVIGYRIFRNGTYIQQVTESTSFVDRSGTPGQAYSYTVTAINNTSAESTATTQSAVYQTMFIPTLSTTTQDQETVLTWAAFPGQDLTEYHLNYAPIESPDQITTNTIPAGQTTTSLRLAAGVQYSFSITPITTSGPYSSSTPLTVTGNAYTTFLATNTTPLSTNRYAGDDQGLIRWLTLDKGTSSTQINPIAKGYVNVTVSSQFTLNSYYGPEKALMTNHSQLWSAGNVPSAWYTLDLTPTVAKINLTGVRYVTYSQSPNDMIEAYTTSGGWIQVWKRNANEFGTINRYIALNNIPAEKLRFTQASNTQGWPEIMGIEVYGQASLK